MAIQVNLVTSSTPTTLNGNWESGNCTGTISYDVQLFKDDVLHINFNSSATNHSFVNLLPGIYYLTIVIYTFDNFDSVGELCDSGTSASIVLSTPAVANYCIPSDRTNIRFSDLAAFYDINNADIRLSGITNPSSGTSIFGRSVLPDTGIISKTTPNAVSELRGTCGGVSDIFRTTSVGDSFFRYTGTVSEGSNFSAGFGINSSTGMFLFLNPSSPNLSFSVCGEFTNQRPEIRQTNGVIGVDDAGSKTIRIVFASSNLKVPLTGTIIVRRLSDNAIVASSIINSPIGANLFVNGYTLNWSNSANNTKISVIVTVDQGCVV
jgi:hypothetical protein